MAAGSAAPELAALYPAPKPVEIAGRTVEIRKAGIRHGTEVVQRGMALAATFGDDADELIIADERPEEVADLLAFATGCDRDWALTLDAVQKVDLACAWLEVNGRFFLLRLPQARARLQAAVAEFVGAGPTPSTTSSLTDTPAPTTTRQKHSPSTQRPSPAPKGASGAPA